MNIGQLITHLILNSSKTNSEIAMIVKTQFDSKTSEACVAWYKTQLRKKGLLEGKKQKYKAELSAEQLEQLCK